MPRKGENIYKRKDGRWEGRYIKKMPDGKTRYGYVYARTYRDARQKLRVAAAQWQQSPTFSEETITFREVAALWEHTLEHRVKDSTRAKYHTILRKHLLPQLGDMDVSRLTHRCLENHAQTLLEHGGKGGQPLSPHTVSDVMAVLRNVLRYAEQNGVAVGCDGSSVRIRKAQTEIKILSRTEQKIPLLRLVPL